LKSPILFIGYEPSLHDEIREFLRERQGKAHFTSSAEETIRLMERSSIGTVVLKMQRLEDAAILRYINIHFQGTQVLVMPGENLREAIPALAEGNYEILSEPFRLDELRALLGTS
jgi:DNA-binding NtrC family response regulator